MKKKTTFENTVELIKEKIISGEWAPGDRIPTLKDLAHEFSVSITTMREALRILESQGNISIEHGRGMYVRNDPLLLENPAMELRELGNISLISLLEARLLIEPELTYLCAKRATTTQIQQLRDLANQMDAQMRNGGSFFETDFAFHQIIKEGAGQPILSRMMDNISSILIEGRKKTNTLPNMRTKAAVYHTLIAIAIEERQAEQARQLMKTHIEEMLIPLQKKKEEE